jgi:phosphopantothenoylcysteine decarboxylase/phosphopantothenate--cysteine ligase
LEHFPMCTMAILAAAVADYRPAEKHAQKLKRGKGPLELSLEPTADILADIARAKGDRIVAGFAAETDHLAENARKKLAGKNVDLIAANDVTAEGAGFDTDTNVVTLFARDNRELALPRMSKFEVAQRMLDEILRLRGILRLAPAAQRSSVQGA